MLRCGAVISCLLFGLALSGCPDGHRDEWAFDPIQGDPAPPELVWTKILYEQPQGDFGNVALVTDADGQVAMAGRLRTPKGGASLFLSRLPTAGEPAWSKVAFADDWQPDVALAATPDGDLVLAAAFRGPTALGAEEIGQPGRWNLLVARLRAADGQIRWQRIFGLAACRVTPRLAADVQGQIWLAGHFDGRIDFTPESLTADPDGDLFLARLRATGQPIWARQFGGRGPHRLAGFAADAEGGLLLAGWFGRELGLGRDRLEGAHPPTGFVARLADDGSLDWAQVLAAPGGVRPTGLAVLPDGAAAVIGNHRGGLSAGSLRAEADQQHQRCFAARFARDGEVSWLRALGGDGEVACTAAGADPRLGLVLAGAFTGTAALGPGELQAGPGRRLFVARLEPRTGSALWARAFGQGVAPGPVAVDGLVLASADSLIVAGDFLGPFPLGGRNWHPGPIPFALLSEIKPHAAARK